MNFQCPHCAGMEELPCAKDDRAKFYISRDSDSISTLPQELSHHFSHGLAYTTGSALGSTPPTIDECIAAFVLPNKPGNILSTGARAWSKHSHRSDPQHDDTANSRAKSDGWWGTPSGPAGGINERAVLLFWKVMNGATWRNLHWLPHRVLVYEVRVAEGYGMRWSQDQSSLFIGEEAGEGEPKTADACGLPWTFRGFVEPMMENGHDVGWRH